MLHVDFSPMLDHMWEKCPSNTNACSRKKNRDAKDGVPVPISKDLSIFTKWTNHTVLSTLLQKKDAVFLTEVGAVIPEQKLLK